MHSILHVRHDLFCAYLMVVPPSVSSVTQAFLLPKEDTKYNFAYFEASKTRRTALETAT